MVFQLGIPVSYVIKQHNFSFRFFPILSDYLNHKYFQLFRILQSIGKFLEIRERQYFRAIGPKR